MIGSAVRMNAGHAWLLVLLIASQATTAQDPKLKTRTKEEREALYASTHRITLNVQVTDSAGNPVSDLAAGDFTIYDNQQPRKISAFHAIDGAGMYDATRVVILLDAVNSPAQALDAGKNGIFKYLAQSRGPFSSPTSFALWFNGHLDATAATIDRNSVGRAFVKMTKGVHSNACNTDTDPTQQKVTMRTGSGNADAATCRAVHFRDSIAALEGIALEQQAGGGRTLLIWVGTGWPTISEEEFQRLPPKNQREYAQEIVSLTRDLRASQVTLYSISPADRDQDGKAPDPPIEVLASSQASVQTPNAVARHLALHELSRRTGGRVIAASDDIAADVGSCVRDASWYYAVSFNAPPAQNGPGEVHSLAIKVNRPDLQVRTMTTYYSEP